MNLCGFVSCAVPETLFQVFRIISYSQLCRLERKQPIIVIVISIFIVILVVLVLVVVVV